MINLRGLAINFGIDHIAVTGLLTAAAVILTIAACWRAPLWRAVAAASAGSLLVAPHVYGYDAGLLLVGLWLAMFEGGEQRATRFPRIAATVLLTPIPFLLSLAGSPWSAATPLALLAFLASLACMGAAVILRAGANICDTSANTHAVTAAGRPSVPRMDAILASRWARVLIPSLSDLFFLAILVWLFMSSGAAGWQGLLADADVGWHIRTGEYILDHHAVPHVDLYSFSKPGAPWYAWEWLTDVIDGGLHRMAGLKGIVLLAAVLIALFALTLVRRMVSRDAHLFVALLVALLGVGGSSIHFLARPHLLTLLLLSISVWMIEEDRKRPSSRIWWLVPLTMVWTNLHGGFLALIVVLGLATVGSAIEAFFGSGFGFHGTIRDSVRYAKLTLACAAASLVNPYGWNLHRHVVEYLRSDWIRNVIQEFQSPIFRSENMLQFEALLLIGLIVAGAQFRRWKIVEGLWIVFWAHMALGSVRHAPIFIAVTAPIIAGQLSCWWNHWTAHVKNSSLPGILNLMAADALKGFRRTSAWPAAAVAALVLMGAASSTASSGRRIFPNSCFR